MSFGPRLLNTVLGAVVFAELLLAVAGIPYWIGPAAPPPAFWG